MAKIIILYSVMCNPEVELEQYKDEFRIGEYEVLWRDQNEREHVLIEMILRDTNTDLIYLCTVLKFDEDSYALVGKLHLLDRDLIEKLYFIVRE